jgi:ATP-dependent Lhr-like helicase
LLVALHPDATLAPPIEAPADCAPAGDDRSDALREIVRARLAGLGPTTVRALADPLGVATADVDAALAALQQEGTVLQGRFGPEAMAGGAIEWCERHLLARIHRYTLGRLRREIEPVEPRDFARFVFEWQHVAPGARVSGPDALAGVLAQLEGFEAPAASWETELLPARVGDYAPRWLDELCTSGRTVWTRLRPTAGDARGGVLRATPILLLPRRSAAIWSVLPPAPTGEERLGSRARRVADFLAEHGASFFDDIAAGVRLLPAELEDALAELVVHGVVHGDSYAGLRALLVPPSRRAAKAARGRAGWFGVPDAGRWSLTRRRAAPAAESTTRAAALDSPALEHVARTLLRRYGVVCWRLLEREPGWLPPWRDLLRVYRRLEARGEIRGGRFVAGFSGEQFALPDAVGLLRETRRRPASGEWVSLSGADPLNLIGILTPGQRLSALTANRVVYRDGLPVAALTGGKAQFLTELETAEQWEAEKRLVRSAARGRLADLV